MLSGRRCGKAGAGIPGEDIPGYLLLLFFFLQDKMVFIYLKQPVALHFSQFIGQGAAIYAEIIRQLLTVKGDREVRALGLRSLAGEVGYRRPRDTCRRAGRKA